METNSAGIIEAARRTTQLHDFDDESFREGLDLVTRNLAVNPSLSEAGRETIAGIAVACLANRLRVADYARRHPRVMDRPVARPIFILGAPRTGTTLVSHLLAADPARRSLLRWEALDSVPPATEQTLRTDPRCLAMKKADNPALQASSHIHHEEADTPTECVIIHAQDFKSLLFDVASDDPLYAEWILHCDLAPTYRYHKLELQVLQTHTAGNWALKAPSHALFIHDLLKIYPDARIIWTHRDPYRAFGSLCSLIDAFRRRFSKVDPASLGQKYLEHFKLHLDRPQQVDLRERDRIYHLHYARLVRDPLAEMGRLYAWLGETLSDEAADLARRWLRENPRGKFGPHSYRLATYGVSVAELRPHFKPYIERYSVTLDGEDL